MKHLRSMLVPALGLAIFAGVNAAGAPARAGDEHDAGACEHCRLAALQQPGGPTRRDFDSATGRSRLNFPPHRFADYQRLVLNIAIVDMDQPRFTASAAYTLAPVGNPVPTLRLSCGPAPSMTISAVRVEEPAGHAVTFKHEGESLVLSFAPALAVDARARVVIDYTVNQPVGGLTWTPANAANKDRPAQLHSQGQAESNHFWFPCHDFPNERMSTEMYVTVPKGYIVSSNGKLVERGNPLASGPTGNSGQYEMFHWVQDRPHVSYLVSLVVGKFDVVRIGAIRNPDGSSGGPVEVYAPLGRGGDVQRTYGRTPEMIAYFADYLHQAYPWDRYAQLVVHNFAAGGMENTSATTMYDTAILDEHALMDGDLDGLISHELGHQWFGDLITCKSWEHIWLNEGFATYMTALWNERREGMDGYLMGLYQSRRGLARVDHADAPRTPGMASRVYGNPWEAFGRAANPYGKGSFILHMLRMQLGDAVFRDAMSRYVHRFKDSLVETSDFRRTLEETSGAALERFFNQWVVRPGVPVVNIKSAWDSASSTLVISASQAQPIDGDNPAFDLTIPVWFQNDGGQWTKTSFTFDTKSTEAKFPMAAAPTRIVIDPMAAVLAEYHVSMEPMQAIDLLKNGPTIVARMDAIEPVAALLNVAGVELSHQAGQALLAVAADEKAHHSLRQAAIEALAKGAPHDFAQWLMHSTPVDPRVRSAALSAISQIKITDDVKPHAEAFGAFVAGMLNPRESYGTQAAAIHALAHLKTADAVSRITACLDIESQHDGVRQAALQALADLNAAGALQTALRYSQEPALARTRTLAASLIGSLFKQDPAAAMARLGELVNDANGRVGRSAGQTLASCGDPRAVEVLTKARQSASTEAQRRLIDEWIRQAKAEKPVGTP